MQLSTNLGTDDVNSQRTFLGLTKNSIQSISKEGKDIAKWMVSEDLSHLGSPLDLLHHFQKF